MQKQLGATLKLENGMEFKGFSFGHTESVSGDVVFSTAMVGYPEQLTDATYSGQILCLSYPLVGNYGVPSEEVTAEGLSLHLDSDRIHPRGLIIFDYCEKYSNWAACKSLEQWMKEQKLTGIYGIDTRELTKVIRDNGSMKGVIIPEGAEAVEFAQTCENPVACVSCTEPVTYKGEGKKVVLVDCGVKHSIIRGLLARGVEVIRVPYNYDFTSMEYDGVYVSNGPGDPAACTETVEILKKVLATDKPVFGLNLGYLLVARAAGCETAKLARPHRSANQPVRKTGSNRAYITSQNAAYTVVENSIPSDWEVIFTNLNDGSVDGIRNKNKTQMGANFNPEVCIGLNENFTLIDEFISKL